MDDLDLNINNYELMDLCNLFKMPLVFDDNHLKEAKKMVLMTHPDKSRLPKEYFLFFSKAYKFVFNIFQLRKNGKNKTTEYTELVHETDEFRNPFADKIKNLKVNDFNKWFNKVFEENKLQDDELENGYGDWLKGDEDELEKEMQGLDLDGKTWSDKMEIIERRKRIIRDKYALISTKDIQTFENNSGLYGLTREKPEEYSSGLFSNLQYVDLKKAHTESVIPVTEEDYKNVKKYRNMDELQRDREMDKRGYTWNQDYFDKKMQDKERIMNEENTYRAYKLAQQDEIVREINKKWGAHFNALTYE